MAEGVRKLFFGDRDEKLSREFGLRRDNVSPTSPSGFNCCAEGLGIRVFTQPGSFPYMLSPRRLKSLDRHSLEIFC